MTNVYVGPEKIQRVLSSILKVPFEHKFKYNEVKNIVAKRQQRMFFAIPALCRENETDLLKTIPIGFASFGELYRVAFDRTAVRTHTVLEEVDNYVSISKYDKEKNSWVLVKKHSLKDRKLYREGHQMGQIERLFRGLFSHKDELLPH